MKHYISTSKELSPRPRSKRRNGAGGGTGGGSTTVFQQAAGMFLSRLYRDIAEGHITFAQGLTTLSSIFLGVYENGLKGGKLTPEGYAELESLWVRTMATIGDGTQHQDDSGKDIPALQVKGNSTFTGNLGSEDFISDFLGGKGWSIKKTAFVNAAGETEYKYTLEVDNVTARGILRVYEMVASQMRGENDNVTFSARMKVHHYDPSTGKVWLDTEGEQLMCVFAHDDCIMVQRYQPGNDVVSGGDGYITKNYELVIDEWGTGGATNEAGERLDWVTFKNFTTQMENGTAEGLIAKGDNFTRVDNLTDPERKGIIQIMTVGENRPHIDIIHSLKTDPDNALKGRLGNLEGIRHHLFGWLKGFGEYLINAYIVGDVRLRRTGESLDTLLEILSGQLATKITETVYDITADDNFLSNAGFTELDENGGLKDWTASNDDASFFTVDGEPVVSSVGPLGDVKSVVKTEDIDGKLVLHIVNGTVTQSKSVMEVPGTHKEYDEGTTDAQTDTYRTVRDTLYMAVRILVKRGGTLTIGFPSANDTEDTALRAKTSVLERGSEWVTYQWSGTWNGNSDFVLGFTGECYVSLLSLTTEPLSTFKTEYSTQIRQTSRNISLIATKTSANESSIAELRVEAERISSTVTQNYETLDGKIGQNTSLIEQTATAIRLEVQSVSDDLDGVTTRVGTLEVHDTNITARVTSSETTISQHSSALDDIDTDLTGLHGDVTTITTRIGELTVTDTNITARVSTVETTTAQHTTDISGLSDDVDGLSDDLDTTNTNLVSVTTRVGQLEVTSTNITARVSTVETTTAQHTTDISGLSDDVDGLSDDLDTTNTNLVSVTTRVGQLEVTSTNITARVSTVETTTAQHTTDISGLSDDVDGLSDDVTTLYNADTEIRSRVGSLEVSSSNITSRVSAVESRPMQICDVDFWEQGTTDEESGYSYDAIKRNSTTRIRTKNVYPVTNATVCMLSNYGKTNMMVGFVYFTRTKVVCSEEWSGWKSQSDYGGKIDVGAPSDCAYIAVLMMFKNGSTIEVSNVINSGIMITNDKVVSQAEISLFITEDDLSNITLSADQIDFHFTKNTSFYAKGVEVMNLDTNGNLWIKGEYRGGEITRQINIDSDESGAIVIRKYNSTTGKYEGVVRINATEGSKNSSETNVTQLDAGGLLIRWGDEGFKLTNEGKFLRYNSVISDWTNFYAGRFARFISTSSGNVNINKDDDFVVLVNDGNIVYLPSDAPDGKVLSIRNRGGTNNIRAGASDHKIRDFNDWHTGMSQGRDLNNDERAELVYNSSAKTWYMNIIGS